jgi:hypothetical protein
MAPPRLALRHVFNGNQRDRVERLLSVRKDLIPFSMDCRVSFVIGVVNQRVIMKH